MMSECGVDLDVHGNWGGLNGMNKLKKGAFTFTLGLTALVVLWTGVVSFGCRHVPFYRMTNKASQSLPLSREGIAAYERGDLDEAEEKLAKAVELNDDLETCRYYGETLWKRGKKVEAMEVLRLAADKNGAIDSQSSLYRSLGEKTLSVDRPDQTLLWANRIIDLSPKSAVGWELRGKALRDLGKKEEALDDFQRAAHFAVDDRSLLRDVATIQNETEKYDAALATWQYLEQLYPTNREPAEVLAGKGDAYSGLGLLADAQNSYEAAVRIAPNEPDYRIRLVETTIALKDFKRASDLLTEATAAVPNDPTLNRLSQTVKLMDSELAEKPGDNSRLR